MKKNIVEFEKASALKAIALELQSNISKLNEKYLINEQIANFLKTYNLTIEKRLKDVLSLIDSGQLKEESALVEIIKAANDVIKYTTTVYTSTNEQRIQLKGFIDGAKSSAIVVENSSNSFLREGQKILDLVEKNEEIEKKRKPGKRPETLRVKRRVEEIKKQNDKESEILDENENT